MKRLAYIFTLIATLLVGAATCAYAQPRIKGNVYGGGENAKVVGDIYTYEEYKDLPGNSEVSKEAFNNLPVEQKLKSLTGTQTTVTFNNGEVYGNIYGGGALANVYGNTNVVIDEVNETKKGKFAGDVFGGGMGSTDDGLKYANVSGNTNVSVKGGEIIWNKKWDKQNKQIVEWGTSNGSQFFNETNKTYAATHNIYAGGNIACVVGTWNAEGTEITSGGTSTLTMTHGLLSGELLNSDHWKQAYTEHEHPHFYAFGGGYGIYTKAHESDVQILLPMFDVEGANGGDEQLARPRKAARNGGNEELLPIITDAYGVAWTTVLGVLGGGYNGHVEKTNVLVGDATYAHRVYGGGLGSYEGWVQASDNGTPNTNEAGYVGTTGKLPLADVPDAALQTTHVTIAGGHIHGDVFGGGAGVAPGKQVETDGIKSLDRTAANTEFTDFTEIARVKGNTLVETTSYETYLTSKGTADPEKPSEERAQIFGNVYGGGDVANVTGNTNVSLFGGDVFGYTFGAGLGRLTTQALDYTTIGNVTGNATVTTADLVDWTDISLPDNYEEPYIPRAWDDIYGGGRNGVTGGNATVNINGGYVGNNIFGGGLGNVDGANITSADVMGNTTVTVIGGQYLWREIADINGNIKKFVDVAEEFDRNIIDNKMMLTPLLEPIEDFFDYRTASYTRDHSIYGGGNIACRVGTYASPVGTDQPLTAPTSGGKSTVDMQHGLFADTDIHWTDDDKWNLATLCRWLACENSSNYQFGVFGGGYGANTKVGETDVKLEMGTSEANKAKWNAYFGKIHEWFGQVSEEDQKLYYGGKEGPNVEARYLTARMANSINVPSHTVLTTAGGGLAGYVAGNTSVHQYERSGSLRVFGGGIGLRPSATELATLDQTAADAMTYGQVGGNTKVDIEYGVVVKDVFGGGAGIESLQNKSGYVDFTNMARVMGTTDVHIHATDNQPTQTLVYGRVFGGGDVANVGTTPVTEAKTSRELSQDIAGYTTKVKVDGGCVFNAVFAGGSGRLKSMCSEDAANPENDGYKHLGAVYGNTQITIDEPKAAGTNAPMLNATWLWNQVYGGGQNGTVYGNTDVIISGGNLGYDVFGGGLGDISEVQTAQGSRESKTFANVKQNTNVTVRGGQYCLSQMWNDVTNNWAMTNKKDETYFSSQYDPENTRLIISHNIYGGGNVACTVGHDTYVGMTKGLLPKRNALGREDVENLFVEPEWTNIHNKHASPFFSVFGGGYGSDTEVSNDSHVYIAMAALGDGDDYKPSKYQNPNNLSSTFLDRQSLLDVIGGGYEGTVKNVCNVEIGGNTFMRNVFGGAYYATVGATNVDIIQGNMEDVYGGGMMGDVENYAHVNIGMVGTDDDVVASNKELVILKNVYGANDVSGLVGARENELTAEVQPTPDAEGVVMKLYGGTVYGNVYGSGNGNYQYMLDQSVTKVTPRENYHFSVGGRDAIEDIYMTPVRQADFPSLSAMSPAQKIVNITSYRPSTSKVNMDIKGNSATDRLVVKGSIFGGGNSATVSTFAVKNDAGKTPDYGVKMNLGSHVTANALFFGSDGRELFNTENYFIANFEELNHVKLKNSIDWDDVQNIDIPEKFLAVAADRRPDIYKTLLDLYFLPVEMDFMPEFTWSGQNNSVKVASGEHIYNTTTDFEDTELGTFCCGGNRGNMNTSTNFHVNFPEGLTITDKIVGGCNEANYKFALEDEFDPITGLQKTKTHEGGYLLGTHHVGLERVPQIHLTLRNKFRLEETDGEYLEACNVFGGCYQSGTVRGDILVEVYSNMLHSAGKDGTGLDVEKLKAANARNEDPNAVRTNSIASIYGGGYGPDSWVYGDTEVRLGNNTDEHNSVLDAHEKTFNVTGSSCNFLFGGGCQGNIVGNTSVRMYNGRVAGCIVGASFKGSLYGNAQTMVGYPARYYRAQETGVFKLARTDNASAHADYRDENGSKIIRTEVYYTKGDLVPRVVYDEIVAKITETMDSEGSVSWSETPLDVEGKNALFSMEHSIPGEEYKSAYDADPNSGEGKKFNDWSNINIHIDKAIYGGGYAIMNGENSDPFTVKKYTDIHKEGDDRTFRFLDTQIDDTYGVKDSRLFNHYGGNTFVMLGDISGDYEKQAVADSELAPMSTRDGSNPNIITAEGQRNKDHINISSRSLDPVATSTGDDLFGLFYEMTNEERYGAAYCEEHHLTLTAPSGSYMKMSYEAYKQASDQHQYYNFVGEGGVYGDGRLSLSEGFRTCEAIGYGYNGTTPEEPKLMNCIHRFDITRFKDCCISLLGDRDYASAEGQSPNAASYSIARVSEIVMESSIDQRYDYLTKNLKFSRNYIGLSNAQFDLAAIKSNVDFLPVDREKGETPTANAYYHNKSGQVIYENMPVEGSENDQGVAQTHFAHEETYYDVKRWYLNEYEIGSGTSDYYDNVIAQVKNEKLFQLRNSATSKNMFGVFSGYALTVRNNHYDIHGAHPYWGPVKGVFEIDLIGTRNGEAGGYAYAQNIHEEPVIDSEGNTVHSFLETSGNFVFPANETRKVVDNCFPTAYSSTERDRAEGHYWYVTGFRYFYNVNITGYTYDTDVRYFNMENDSHLIFMPGAKAGQTITLQSFHFLNRHSTEQKHDDCDIENKFISGANGWTVDGYNTENDIRTYWNDRSKGNDFNIPFYNLSLSISDKDVYSTTTDKDDVTFTVPHYESLMQDKFTIVEEDNGKGGKVNVKKYEDQNYKLDGTVPFNEPLISIQLKDIVKNNGMYDEENGITYKDKYLSEPCQAVLVLTTPVVNDRGQFVYDAYEPVPKKGTGSGTPDLDASAFNEDYKYSILDFNGDYVALEGKDAQEQYDKGAILYTKATAKMLKVGDGSYMSDRHYFKLRTDGDPTNIGTLTTKDYEEFTGEDNTGDWQIQTLTRDEFNAMDKTDLYYLRPNAHTRVYEYNLTITINYLKGPSHTGNINILNCALPGEMIRLRHNNVEIDTDPVSLRHNGNFWIIGPGKKVADDGVDIANGYHWELIDQTGTVDVEETDADGVPVTRKHYNPATRNFYYPYNPWVDKTDEEHYETPISSAVRDGIYHNTEDTNKPDYYVPAYYFMNGYVAQYAYTVANIDEIFVTKAYPMDTLLVHNYHRMLKANVETDKKEDIKLREAVLEMSKAPLLGEDGLEGDELTALQAENEKMRKQWANQHKRPRVYIQNLQDLIEFKNYVERTADRKNSADRVVLPATDYGNGIDFFLLADLDVNSDKTLLPNWTAIRNFKGSLHGNGHVIKGLGENALFSNIDAENGAHIYNLGLPEGKIVSTEVPAAYSNCYTYANKTVYRMNGTAVVTTADGANNTYTDDDWRYGRVAYDLNEYYLAERLDRNTESDNEGTNKDSHDHAGYVENMYCDGEYRFAFYSLKDETETEYLRNQQEPNYQWGFDNDMVNNPDAISNHRYTYDEENRVLSHRVDEARAYYTDAVPAVLYADAAEYNAAKGTSLEDAAFAALSEAEKTKTAAKPRMVSEFRPLIDESKVNSTEELTIDKNDYIFFGQTLNVSTVTDDDGKVGTSLPGVISASANNVQPGNSINTNDRTPIVTHAINDQTNRIWRAYGFYKSKKDDAFHFNRAAWALHPELTAIDFTGAHDSNHSWESGMIAGNDTKERMFYPMVMDKPDNLASFNVMSNRNYNADGSERPIAQYDNSNYGRVTQNLLVYNNSEKTAGGTDVFTSTDVTIDDENVTYSEEKDVLYHNLVFSGSPAEASTDYFHLVDKQDFNAPIAFNVGTRAWYERMPSVFRNVSGTGESYATPSAWEGIILPFTAKNVTASENKEISHFYGEVPAEGENMQTLHHEYWLKGMVAADGDKATFARPSKAGSGLFTDNTLHRQDYATNETPYKYPANTYFTGLTNYTDYHDSDYNDGDTAGDEWARSDQEWYLSNHYFADYVYLSKTVPYLISFPGNDFYEFSLEGTNYNTSTHTKSGAPQLVTFAHDGAVTIAVSDDETGTHTTTIGSHNHVGTYKHETGKLGVNNDGSAFTIEAGDVLPFRTYLTETTPSPARARRVLIYDSNVDGMEGILQEEEREPENPGEELSGKSLKMYVMGTELIIESNFVTDLRTYTAAGQYIRLLHVNEGVNRYNELGRGIYIIGNKKVIIR